MITKERALVAVSAAEELLTGYVQELKSSQMDHDRTQFLRGRIDALESILDAAQEVPPG